jgi:hypothetical protein
MFEFEQESQGGSHHYWRARMMVRSAPQYLQTFASGKINSAQRSQGTRFLSSRGFVALLPRHRERIATPNATHTNNKNRNRIRPLVF